MKDEQNEIIELVADLWAKHPHQRFGQLLENYVFGHHNNHKSGCIFHIVDRDILATLREYRGNE